MARQKPQKGAQYLRPNIGSTAASHPQATKEDVLNEEKTGAKPQQSEVVVTTSKELTAPQPEQQPAAPYRRLSEVVGEPAIRAVEEQLRKQHPS